MLVPANHVEPKEKLPSKNFFFSFLFTSLSAPIDPRTHCDSHSSSIYIHTHHYDCRPKPSHQVHFPRCCQFRARLLHHLPHTVPGSLGRAAGSRCPEAVAQPRWDLGWVAETQKRGPQGCQNSAEKPWAAASAICCHRLDLEGPYHLPPRQHCCLWRR